MEKGGKCMFDIVLLAILTLNLILTFAAYSIIYERTRKLETRLDNGKSIKERFQEHKESKIQYNESVDPVTMDAEMHDYLVRLAKEERE